VNNKTTTAVLSEKTDMNEIDIHPIDTSLVKVIIIEAEMIRTITKGLVVSLMIVIDTNPRGMSMNHMTVMRDRIEKGPAEDGAMISVNNFQMKCTHPTSLIKIGITVIELDDE
jgi:hypothetical protein